ncbi:MAG: SDR family oxidoreductase [Pseudomonadota bacterium]
MKTALIAGATGVVGRNLMAELLTLPDWQVIALSRRKPDLEGDYRHLAVDLSDPADSRAKLGDLSDVTHAFFAAYVEVPGGWPALVAPNLALFRNFLDGLQPAAKDLQHVNLMEGTKWYGSHLGPFKTPAKEDDPRHLPPNFYYDQQDLLSGRQAGQAWSWSAARPHAVCGYASGNPMNLVLAIAVYASLCKALGLPLRHPGSLGNQRALYQVTDAGLLARSLVWMAESPAAANQAFNITNGDLFRWEQLWPRFAEAFGLDWAPAQPLNLTQMMTDKAPLWAELVKQHDLQPLPFERLVSWPFADYVFAADWDIASATTKAKLAGFHEVQDSEAMFLRHFDELRAARVIP